MKDKNSIWDLFASVKLALFLLAILAITSIVGTIIPQKEPADFYIAQYGPKTAQFFQLFDIPQMYSSWWFLGLLCLLCTNLVICSIERFPGTWQQIKADTLNTPPEHIRKMAMSATFTTSRGVDETVGIVELYLKKHGWKPVFRQDGDTTLVAGQKGRWSRTGVYLVHTSILIIFAGAIYGQLTGFKGSIMLPELQSSNIIYPFNNQKPIELGFEIRCERFDIEFYANGMPKEYRSELTILEDGKSTLRKTIVVNDPLKYRGITFYQSSYQGFRNFLVGVGEERGEEKLFISEFQKQVDWSEKNLSFGIINLESIRDQATRLKIWFTDGKGAPSEFWMNAGEQVTIKRQDNTYLFSAKQRYATGLQVAKDPGVWVVYFGFGVMLLGLYMAFFMTHRRIWLLVEARAGKTEIIFSASTNKNRMGLENSFKNMRLQLEQNTL